MVVNWLYVEEVVADYHSDCHHCDIFEWFNKSLWSSRMNVPNRDYILLHADAEWMKDILQRISDILNNDPVTDEDLQACRWLIKQALKVEKED
jgi:protein gp37